MLSEWKKIRGINLQGHFCHRLQFGKLGSGTFQSHFKVLNDVFRVIVFETCAHSLDSVLNLDTFPTLYTVRQSWLVCKSYASYKLTYRVDHHGKRG
jgi:hypothetical protein